MKLGWKLFSKRTKIIFSVVAVDAEFHRSSIKVDSETFHAVSLYEDSFS